MRSLFHSVSRFIARCEVFLIRIYQTYRYGKPTRCRYTPRCDAYAVDAFHTHGLWRANWLMISRIARCRPRGGWGYDPVPHPNSTNSKDLAS